MPIVFPPKFKASQLREVARLCGKSRSGTKADLTGRISDDLREFKPLAPGTRVLSIDLGIRNLAYCLLEVPEITNEARVTKTRGRKNKESISSQAPAIPILHAWERIALIPKVTKPTTKKSKKAATTETKTRKTDKNAEPETSAQAAETQPLAPAVDDPTTTPVAIQDFSPARLSQLAVDLLLHRLLPLRPDVVTLEQQRFRSMGSSAVFEWTLRVNSLEAMLYTGLTMLRTLGRWDGAGRLESVVARNVQDFMAAQAGMVEGNWQEELQKDNKRVKKNIIGKMLSEGIGVSPMEGVGPVVGEYITKWSMKGKRGKIGSAENVKKMDDLADCLLQGLAFIRWQENKRRLVEGGVEALEDQILAM